MTSLTLAEAIAEYGNEAYLLTISNSGPHTSHVSVRLRGNIIECAIGSSATRNISSKPNVSLFWPPRELGGYAMIVNGVAGSKPGIEGTSMVEIKLTKSVLHRRGLQPSGGGDGACASDCTRIVQHG